MTGLLPTDYFHSPKRYAQRQARQRIAEYCREHTMAEAVAHFGCAVSHVSRSCHEFGVRPPREYRTWIDYEPRDAAIVEAFVAGNSKAQIARMYGLSPERIRQIVRGVG